jgi:hypothetical protein
MIDPTHEDLMSLTEAAQSLPKRRRGKRPSISCLYRWTQQGVRGVRLESIQIGGTRCTSREAIARFIERLSARRTGESYPNTIRSAACRERDCQRAEEKLRSRGV